MSAEEFYKHGSKETIEINRFSKVNLNLLNYLFTFKLYRFSVMLDLINANFHQCHQMYMLVEKINSNEVIYF